MITRKVDKDDPQAGFTYNWVKKLGEKLDKLYVITWQESDRGDLPENIEIISLPKNKLAKIVVLKLEAMKLLSRVDGVFCHQNPEYTILVGLLARIFRKKVVSWYTHKAVNWRRRLMEVLANQVLTASKESFRKPLFPEKVKIIGHGIDINYFRDQKTEISGQGNFKILSVGRISPIKDYETLIEAIEFLIKQKRIDNLEVQIVGGPVLKKEKEYEKKIKELVKEKELEKYIKFVGPIPHNQILSYYQNCDLFVNLSQTGSVDKVVLEAMACQKLVLTCNEAFEDILNKELLFEQKNSHDLANKIISLMNLSDKDREEIASDLRNIVVKNHNLNKLIDKIIEQFQR
jgi:glycosyltransferase involved in cell wall biosynthesis